MFRVAYAGAVLGRVRGRFAAGELGASKAAALFDAASAYNLNLAAEFRRAFEATGGELVAFESYVSGETDFRPQLGRIRRARPQVLLLPNYFYDAPAQVQQARELSLDARLLGGDSWILLPPAELRQLEGAFFALHWHIAAAETDPAARDFLEQFRQAFGHDPNDGSALTYDAFGLLLRAISLAGDDPDEIRRALAETSGYRGVTGTITYRGTGGDPEKRLIIARIEGGEAAVFKVIEP